MNKIDSGENLHLVISPDSTLWMLPWAALHTREQAFLVEDFVVRTVVSGRDLCRSDSMPELAANNSSVVFSNPDFDEKVVVDKQVTSNNLQANHLSVTRKIELTKGFKIARDSPRSKSNYTTTSFTKKNKAIALCK